MSNNNSKYIPYRIAQVFGYDAVAIYDDEISYNCPFCEKRKGSPDTKGHLSVNTKTFIYHCWRCEASGHIVYDKNANQNKIYKPNIVDENESDELVKSINKIYDDPTFKLKIPVTKVTEHANATKYLLDRGFTIEHMNYYDLRVGNTQFEFGRIIIPNQIDKIIYTDMYSARSFIGQEPKYHNPYGIDKSKIVFNLHKIKNNDAIILVEGPLTAIAAGYHAVASFGKSLSIYQASQILQKNPKVIYVNYDYGAEKFSHDACKLLYSLSPDTPIYEVLMPDDRDAADLSRTEYIERLNNAKPYIPIVDDLLNIINL